MSRSSASRTLLGLSAFALTSLVVISLGWMLTPVKRSYADLDYTCGHLFIG